MGVKRELSLEIENKRLKQLLSAGFSLSKSAKLMGVTYERIKVIARRIQP